MVRDLGPRYAKKLMGVLTTFATVTGCIKTVREDGLTLLNLATNVLAHLGLLSLAAIPLSLLAVWALHLRRILNDATEDRAFNIAKSVIVICAMLFYLYHTALFVAEQYGRSILSNPEAYKWFSITGAIALLGVILLGFSEEIDRRLSRVQRWFKNTDRP